MSEKLIKNKERLEKLKTENDDLIANDKKLIIRYNKPNFLTMPGAGGLDPTRFRLMPGLNCVSKKLWETSTKGHFLFPLLLKKDIKTGLTAIEILNDGDFNTISEYLDSLAKTGHSGKQDVEALVAGTSNPNVLDEIEENATEASVRSSAKNAKETIRKRGKKKED